MKPGKVLYEEKYFRIANNFMDSESHDLIIYGSYFLLDRGILDNLSRHDTETLKQGLEAATNGRIDYSMKENNLSYDSLGWAFSKARIKELENEISYHLEEKRKAEERSIDLVSKLDMY